MTIKELKQILNSIDEDYNVYITYGKIQAEPKIKLISNLNTVNIELIATGCDNCCIHDETCRGYESYE